MNNQTQTGRMVKGADGTPVDASTLVLGIENFRLPEKHYRLIWIEGKTAWLCEEDQASFRERAAAVAIGRALADRVGCMFDEACR